jgi:hypothetical protein
MCYIDRQKNKYSVLNECNRMLKYNMTSIGWGFMAKFVETRQFGTQRQDGDLVGFPGTRGCSHEKRKVSSLCRVYAFLLNVSCTSSAAYVPLVMWSGPAGLDGWRSIFLAALVYRVSVLRGWPALESSLASIQSRYDLSHPSVNNGLLWTHEGVMFVCKVWWPTRRKSITSVA